MYTKYLINIIFVILLLSLIIIRDRIKLPSFKPKSCSYRINTNPELKKKVEGLKSILKTHKTRKSELSVSSLYIIRKINI